ncbi:unnamed protein product [Prunus brigantina]
MFAVTMRFWSRNMPTKSFVEIVPKCIVAFIDYHDTPKLLKMAFGIGIPFEWYEGRGRESPWHLPSLLRLLGLRVDHSRFSTSYTRNACGSC